MTRSGGKRSNTRNMFSQSFRKHGAPNSSIYLQPYSKGELVDIKVNPAVHKGMPFKYYHGKTGKIFNITKSSLGVEVAKTVGNRKILKKIYVKIAHIRKSKSKTEFLNRIYMKDHIRRNRKNTTNKAFSLPRKNFVYNEKHTVAFQKINPLEPESYSVVV